MSEDTTTAKKRARSPRVFYFDLLRALAIVAVITVHTSARNWGGVDVTGSAWLWFSFYDAVARWGVPVFVMVSGALFLDPARQVDFRRVCRKSIPRLLVALAFWSTLYALYKRFTAEKAPALMTTFKAIVQGNYHLWFIYMIVGLYLLIPIVRRITEDEALTRYFLLLSVVFGFALPTLLKAATQLSGMWDSRLLRALIIVLAVYKKMHITFVTGYVCYFVLGCYLHRATLSGRQWLILYALGLAGFVVTVGFSAFVSRQTNSAYEGFYDNLSLNVLAESVCVFVLCKVVGERLATRPMAKVISTVSGLSFGIYLVHDLVLTLLNRLFGINTLSFGQPALMVPAIVLVVLCVSGVITAAIRNVPAVGKVLT